MPLARPSAPPGGLDAVVVDRKGRIRMRDVAVPAAPGRDEQTIAALTLRVRPPDRPPPPGAQSIWIPCSPSRTRARADAPLSCRVTLGPKPTASATAL